MLSFEKQKEIRIATKIIFERVHYNTFSECQLSGRGDIVSQIRQAINYPCSSTIKNIILSVKKDLYKGEEYNCERKKFFHEDKHKIKEGSFKEELLTHYMERDASYETTVEVFNAVHQAEVNEPHVSKKEHL